MQVEVDLAQFPRLRCRRCGLVALVDPALPLDVRLTLTCPNCRGLLLSRRDRDDFGGGGEGGHGGSGRRGPAPGGGPVPSHAAVGLTIAALFLLVVIASFVWLLLTPHQSYWWALTK